MELYGYFPSDDPLYTIMVILEKEGLPASAGGMCGPIFAQTVDILVEKYQLQPMLARQYEDVDEVIEVMEKAEAEGLHTVRLHTGDPSVYGAIREQMDRLDALGITYTVTPGVSSFCGAAAALKAEYTLPGVSQTVIITRMAGRTPVPERESIAALAAHGATMVVFLSTGLLRGLSAALIQGGYAPDTPAAIVYKASWEDEKICRCTVAELAQTAADNGITKTALICVGGFLGDSYQLSKLYDAAFETEFRKAKT